MTRSRNFYFFTEKCVSTRTRTRTRPIAWQDFGLITPVLVSRGRTEHCCRSSERAEGQAGRGDTACRDRDWRSSTHTTVRASWERARSRFSSSRRQISRTRSGSGSRTRLLLSGPDRTARERRCTLVRRRPGLRILVSSEGYTLHRSVSKVGY